MFNTGDKVRVLDDNQKGIVLKIHKNQITVLCDNGFESTYHSNELVADQGFEVGQITLKPEPVQRKNTKKKSKNNEKEIDLHIGQLVDSYANMSNYEMLQLQLQKIKDEMEMASVQKIKKLIFIHGHGKGVLKDEMMKLLRKYKGIAIYDASFRKYNGGATCVEFKR
ncbi:MAG: Smr/MutS family protein [Weeksellaceae bacterium]|jgi:dsDNA-specific endonuclease/ATPase MutS2|nr:Smr/MutS family protein [Weeksellaceae bacterium]